MTAPPQRTKTNIAFTALLPAAACLAFAQAPAAQAATPQAPAPKQEKKHGFEIPKLGIDLGLFVPSDGKTRRRFGKTWSNIGIGIGRPDTPSGTGRIGLDFGVTNKSSGDHHAFIGALGVYYRRAFSADDVTQGRTFIPYYGISADLAGVDLRSPEDNVHSGLRFTVGGSAVAGTTIGASGFAEIKYLAISQVKGFDLSGTSFTAGIRF